MAFDGIPHRLMRQAQVRPDAPAYYQRRAGAWQKTTWAEYAKLARRAGKALIELGFQPGQAVSILGFNRPEWCIFFLGAMSAGGVPAGIYTTSSPEEVRYIVHHSESFAILLE